MRKPFYKKSHKSWYCEIGQKQIRLGTDKVAAFEEYHRLMAGSLPTTSRTPAVMLLDQFLEWTKQNRAQGTYDWYFRHLQSFAKAIGPKLTVSELKPFHVTRWVEKCYKDGSPTYQNMAYRAVIRAFTWSHKQGLIERNPVFGIERPAPESREAYLTPEEWKNLMKIISTDDPFHDLITFLYETGCRPQEARIVEAKHWDKKNLTLERKNSKGKRVRRVIRLNQLARDIVTRLSMKNPEGPLFTNKKNKPWTKSMVNGRFDAIKEKTGVKLFPYIFRHTWCTNALKRGVDPLTVAIFLGHKDATMVMRVYNHLVQDDEFLAAKLKQATGEVA